MSETRPKEGRIMGRAVVSPQEFDATIRKVEVNTCFRFQAGVDDSSAFMVPVTKDGTVAGACIRFTWRQLKAMADLGPPPRQGGHR
jgi:hypothetical protein